MALERDKKDPRWLSKEQSQRIRKGRYIGVHSVDGYPIYQIGRGQICSGCGKKW